MCGADRSWRGGGQRRGVIGARIGTGSGGLKAAEETYDHHYEKIGKLGGPGNSKGRKGNTTVKRRCLVFNSDGYLTGM